LIRSEGSMVGFEPPSMRFQFLFYTGDVSWKGRDLTFEARDLAVKRLQTQRQSKVLQH
jgi:hypothetical protein